MMPQPPSGQAGRVRKAPAAIRKQAASLARDHARDRENMGDPEGAGAMRDLAAAIGRIRLPEDQ